MITNTEREQLLALFYGGYTSDISAILAKRNIVNKHGRPHSAHYIRSVLHGRRSNIEIETAIWELANLRKSTIEKKEAFRRNFLQKKIDNTHWSHNKPDSKE